MRRVGNQNPLPSLEPKPDLGPLQSGDETVIPSSGGMLEEGHGHQASNSMRPSANATGTTAPVLTTLKQLKPHGLGSLAKVLNTNQASIPTRMWSGLKLLTNSLRTCCKGIPKTPTGWPNAAFYEGFVSII